MEHRDTPLLDRDNPQTEPVTGHTKVTRNDWLNIARDVLVKDGVGDVKILSLAKLLGVSRSSFYWYFENREDLLSALLQEWSERNTVQIVRNCGLPAKNISFAVCNFFQCFIDPELFDSGLDFAVREWARRDIDLRDKVDSADAARISAITAMFARHGYDAQDADGRARILYFMQLGYHALKVAEPMNVRVSRLEVYIHGFTGQPVDPEAVATQIAYIKDRGLL